MMQRLTAGLLGLFALTLSAPTVAQGDDFSPPPWDRNHPRAVTAEWEFNTNANPLAPDGPLTNVLTKGSGTAPGGSYGELFGPKSYSSSGSDGAWGFFGEGGMHFQLDNIVDTEPVKFLQMQVTWFPFGNLPVNVSVDPLAAFNTSATGSTPTVPDITTTIDEGGARYTLITWEMHPNPPWERFDLLFTGAAQNNPIFLTQVVVDTISVPEPSSLMLAALGLVALAYAGRRKGWASGARG